MPTFNSIKELHAYLSIAINDSLKNEVADGIKEVIVEKIYEEVYGAGEPIKYERRNFSNGSLGDVETMHSVVPQDGVLVVTADALPKKSAEEGNALDDMSLAENIEYGYGSHDKWWNVKRPFMEKSEEEIKNGQLHIIWLATGLARYGIDVE